MVTALKSLARSHAEYTEVFQASEHYHSYVVQHKFVGEDVTIFQDNREPKLTALRTLCHHLHIPNTSELGAVVSGANLSKPLDLINSNQEFWRGIFGVRLRGSGFKPKTKKNDEGEEVKVTETPEELSKRRFKQGLKY